MNQVKIGPLDDKYLAEMPGSPGMDLWLMLARRMVDVLPECEFDLFVAPAWEIEGGQVVAYRGALLVAKKGDVVLQGVVPTMGDFVNSEVMRDGILQGFRDAFGESEAPITHMMNANMRRRAIRNN